MMEDEAEQKQCVPVTEDARDNLKSAEVYHYFIRALNRELPLSLAPPVQPKSWKHILDHILKNGKALRRR